MKKDTTSTTGPGIGPVTEALADVQQSFERLCLAAGIEALGAMMEADVEAACGHGRDDKREAHRWGRTRGRVGFHGGKVEVERPRIRGSVAESAHRPGAAEDWLGRWAMNLMLTFPPDRARCDCRRGTCRRPGSGVSKSAASRRFVALSAGWTPMSVDLSKLDLLRRRRGISARIWCSSPRSASMATVTSIRWRW